MMNPKTAITAMITVFGLWAAMSYVGDRGYDKVMPKIKAQQEKIEKQKAEFLNQVRQDMAGMGVSEEYINEFENYPDQLDPEFQNQVMQMRPRRPVGRWMGVCKNNGNNLAFFEFEDHEYKYMVKNPGGEDIIEEGDYEYYMMEIVFKPDNGNDYTMEYYMYAPDAIQLFGRNMTFNLEKDNSLKIDF
ncbi:MAG: hypothetical protein GF307_01555 [candidate division Zixibacteria bacterium]|nr:hypothetical protein [candidate division Zixibacteria bacterium]